jgi:hypothetical protein
VMWVRACFLYLLSSQRLFSVKIEKLYCLSYSKPTCCSQSSGTSLAYEFMRRCTCSSSKKPRCTISATILFEVVGALLLFVVLRSTKFIIVKHAPVSRRKISKPLEVILKNRGGAGGRCLRWRGSSPAPYRGSSNCLSLHICWRTSHALYMRKRVLNSLSK